VLYAYQEESVRTGLIHTSAIAGSPEDLLELLAQDDPSLSAVLTDAILELRDRPEGVYPLTNSEEIQTSLAVAEGFLFTPEQAPTQKPSLPWKGLEPSEN